MIKFTLQEKIAHLEARAASGLKMADYAALHNINFSSFRGWPYKVKKALSVNSTHANQEPSLPASDVVEREIIKGAISVAQVSQNSLLTATLVPVKVIESTQKLPSQTHANKPLVFPESNIQTKYHGDTHHIYESNFKQPPPEVTVILPSGLQVKCDIVLLSQVMGVVS